MCNLQHRLLGLSLAQLQEVAPEVGLRPFAARQMAHWLYGKRVATIEQMTNLPLSARQRLQELGYEVGRVEPVEAQTSGDGTKKYLFPTLGGGQVEAVYIPALSSSSASSSSADSAGERATLCVSSQAGCRMGCAFCMTGRQGLAHQLSAGEILNQALSIPESDRLTNIVFMGMGEPLDNLQQVLRALEILTSEWGLGWSPTRITVSTAGLIPQLVQLLNETKVHVAVSLHNPFPAEREALMPVERAYPAAQVVQTLRRHGAAFAHQRRLSFEYILFDGQNDTPRHAAALSELLRGLECRINLIPFHAIPDSPLRGSSPSAIRAFNGLLNRAGILTTTRASRGQDILAACGLLSTKKGAAASPPHKAGGSSGPQARNNAEARQRR